MSAFFRWAGPEHVARLRLIGELQLFVTGVWKPFQEAGYPPERWSEVTTAIERLRPIASRALVAVFQSTLSQEIESRFGSELERISRATS